MKTGRYRRIFINDKLERLHSEYVWQLCDAGAHRVLDLENHFVFVNLRCGQWLAPLRPETVTAAKAGSCAFCPRRITTSPKACGLLRLTPAAQAQFGPGGCVFFIPPGSLIAGQCHRFTTKPILRASK